MHQYEQVNHHQEEEEVVVHELEYGMESLYISERQQNHQKHQKQTITKPSNMEQQTTTTAIQDVITNELQGEITFLVGKMHVSEPKPAQLSYMPYIC